MFWRIHIVKCKPLIPKTLPTQHYCSSIDPRALFKDLKDVPRPLLGNLLDHPLLLYSRDSSNIYFSTHCKGNSLYMFIIYFYFKNLLGNS